MLQQSYGKNELRILRDLGLNSFKILNIVENENPSTELRQEDLVGGFLTDGNHNLVSEPVIISNGTYVVTLKTLTGKSVDLCVENTFTVEQLKEEYHKSQGCPAD